MKEWLRRLLSQDVNASSRRLAYLGVVLAAVFWLTVDLFRHPSIYAEWVSVFMSLCGLAGGGYVFGKTTEKQPEETQGTEKEKT